MIYENENKSIFLISIILATLLLVFISIGSSDAATFNNNESSSVIQNYINSGSDNEIVLDGRFTNLSEINITRNLTIRGGSTNNIQGTGSGTLFNLRNSNVIFINLTISGYQSAINNAYIGSSSNSLENITIIGNKISTNGYAIELHSNRNVSNINIRNNEISSNSNGIHINGGRGVINGNNQNITIANNIIRSDFEAIHFSTEYGFNNNINIINNTLNGSWQTIYFGSGAYRSDFGRNQNINISNNKINCTNGAGIHLNPFNGTNRNINIINNNITSFREGIFAGYGNAQKIQISNNSIKTLNNSGISISADTYISNTIDDIVIFNNIINSELNGVILHSTGNQSNIKISKNKIKNQRYEGIALRDTYYNIYLKNITIDSNVIDSLNNSHFVAGIEISYCRIAENLMITNNNITSQYVGMHLRSGNNTVISNNNIKSRTNGIQFDGSFNYLSILNNNITSGDNGILSPYSSSNFTNFRLCNNNIRSVNSTYTSHAIVLYTNLTSNFTVCNNNISSDKGAGFSLNGNLNKINITDNKISGYYESIYLSNGWTNLNNVNTISINNNNLTSNNSAAIGIHTNNNGNISNVSVVGNNIFAKAEGVYVGSSNRINNVNISYNRILTNGSAVNLNTVGNNNTASANWLGINNFVLGDEFINIDLLSYYVANASLVKSKAVVGDNWTIYYSLYLNGTKNTGDYKLLPYYLGQLYNETNDLWLNFLAKESQLLKVPVNKITVQNLTIVVDNQVLRLGLVESEKAPTNLNLSVIDNKDSFKLVAKLKSPFKYLSGKTINFYLNGKLIGTGITNSKGIATFVYNSKDYGNFDFTASFEGDDLYLGSNDSESVTRYKPPNPNNNSTNNPTKHSSNLNVNAKMKDTGIPVAVLLVILAIIPFVYKKKE